MMTGAGLAVVALAVAFLAIRPGSLPRLSAEEFTEEMVPLALSE